MILIERAAYRVGVNTNVDAYLVALFASMAEVLCETGFAVDGSIARNETLVHYQLVTGAAFETGLVPFLAFEFVLFHPYTNINNTTLDSWATLINAQRYDKSIRQSAQ